MKIIGFLRHFTILDNTLWGNAVLLQSEENRFLIIEDNSLDMFWNSEKVYPIKFDCDSRTVVTIKKCPMNEWIKTIFEYHNVPPCDIEHLTGLESLEWVYLNVHILLYNSFKHC